MASRTRFLTAHQSLHLALIIALAWPTKAVVKQVVALQFRKHLRAQALSTLDDPGHCKARVIVQDRLWYTAKKSKCRHMAVAKGFRRLGRIGLDEAAIRVRQIHAKIMEPDLLAADVTIGFAKIRLRLTRPVAQRHKHLPRPQHGRCHILAHNRISARISPLFAQPLKNAKGRMTLLLVNATVAFKNQINPRNMHFELLRSRSLTASVARWNRKLQHLGNRVAVNAKPPGSLTTAKPINHHSTSDRGIKFHCKHPSSPSMPFHDNK